VEIRFDGKSAVVTGAARGIGFACAELMAESGAKLALVDILAEPLADAAAMLTRKSGAVVPLKRL